MSSSSTHHSLPLTGPTHHPTTQQSWNQRPFPTAFTSFTALTAPTLRGNPRPFIETLPTKPSASTASFTAVPTTPFSAIPIAPRPPIPVSPFPEPFAASPQPLPPPAEEPAAPATEIRPDFTDDDLREAFSPIVEEAVRKAVYAKENGMDTYLEPMLRATIRRALAEYSPASRPFQAPSTFHRFGWHLQALFSSRTYEDILFEKTHRFQVDEVFLVDAASLALVSFASCDPARHASPKRISSTIQRIALQLRDHEGHTRSSFELSDQRTAITRQGSFVCLVAIVRGRSNDLVIADLDYALRRIEDRFRTQFLENGSALLYPLQPFLEDCLLIQAPVSAA